MVDNQEVTIQTTTKMGDAMLHLKVRHLHRMSGDCTFPLIHQAPRPCVLAWGCTKLNKLNNMLHKFETSSKTSLGSDLTSPKSASLLIQECVMKMGHCSEAIKAVMGSMLTGVFKGADQLVPLQTEYSRKMGGWGGV